MEEPAGIRRAGTHGGVPVDEITLRGASGLEARILTYGAVIRELSLPLPTGGRQALVLGFREFAHYPVHSPYFGAIVGRYANRIAGGRFNLDGREWHLDRNENGITTLHGGAGGFSQRVWSIAEHSESSVTLTLDSADGDQGFPGRVSARCRYALEGDQILSVDLGAATDRPTHVNLTNHSYFNLDGSDTILDHRLQVMADALTAVDARNIPTGEIAPVAGTIFDFRSLRRIGRESAEVDHNFVLRAGSPGERLHHAARLESDRSGVALDVWTTKPGLQVYAGHKLAVPVGGLTGRHYGANAGICLETQFFPDSPNRPAFPSPRLDPGETYRHRTEFRFSASRAG